MQNPFSSPANQNQRPLSGKLAENIMHFARVLREAGIPVGPGAVLDALDAAMSGSLRTRDDFYWTLHAVFVKRRDQRELFDQAFHVFWKKPKMLEQLMQLFFHQIAARAGEKAKQAGFRRLAEAMFDKHETSEPPAREEGRHRGRRHLHGLRRGGAAAEGLRADDGGRAGAGASRPSRGCRLHRTEVMTQALADGA